MRELVVKLNAVLRGWVDYFRSGNANRQFAQMQRYIWERMARFECKRRKRKVPYTDPTYDRQWYQSLGIERLVGVKRYPNPSLVLVKANSN
jgi:RNA-directed DNA polymerase